MLNKTACSALLLCLCFVSQAQNVRVQAITVADGLSQGFVSCVLEDRRGFIWIGTYSGLNRYDGHQVKRFTPDHTAKWSLTANFMHVIAEDKLGLLWIGTEKGPVVLDPYSERFVHLSEFVPDLPKSEAFHIIVGKDGYVWICHRQPNTSGVVVVRSPGDFVQLIRQGRVADGAFEVRHIQLSKGVKGPISWLYQLQDTIWAAGDSQSRFCRIDSRTLIAKRADPRTLGYKRHGNYGLFYKNINEGFVFMPAEAHQNMPDNHSRWSEFIQLPNGRILLFRSGTSTLAVLDTLKQHREAPGYECLDFYKQYEPFFELDKLPSQAKMVDREGNLWIGTTGYGIRKISWRTLEYTRYMPETSVSNFYFLPNGRIWPGIFDPLSVLNLHTNMLEPPLWAKEVSPNARAYGILVSRKGDWWVTCALKERLILYKKDHATGRWAEFPVSLKWHKDVPVRLIEDRDEAIWVSGNQGQLVRIRPHEKEVSQWDVGKYFPARLTATMRSNCLVEDRSGNLWIGSSIGLIQVENPGGEPVFHAWHNNTDRGPLFKSDWISCIYPEPDSAHVVWLGLRGGGLLHFDSRTQACEYFTEKEGLADNVIYGIVPDTFGDFWLSTNRGLSRFHPQSKSFTNYQEEAPALQTEFNTGGYGLAPSGALAFGSTEGLFLVKPRCESKNTRLPVVEITTIEVNGQAIDFPCEKNCLSLRPDNTMALRLPNDRNNLGLRFAAPNAAEPAEVQFRYRLFPLSKYWVNTGFQRTTNFVGIPPGTYRIELQAKNPENNWDGAPTTTLSLTILPPWYRSTWAYLSYALLLFLLFRLYMHMVRKRMTLEHDMALGRKEMEQLKNLDTFKNRFFSYVSHEFKTPLTIIIGLTERLRREQKNTTTAENIARQGQTLLELVEQMVDIARMDERTLHLNQVQGNFSQYVRYLVESHRPLADFGKVRLEVFTAAPDIVMDFDPMRLKYIVSNLLSNAIRHTRPGGYVRVSVRQTELERVCFEVADTGSGIAPEDLPHIFERYFRGHHEEDANASRHFGLGLAFVKDLVDLFKGNIAAKSTPGQGATFTFVLPIKRQAPPMANQLVSFTHTHPKKSAFDPVPTSHRPVLLVVEDNPVIADYVQSCLHMHFRIDLATDGLLGWEAALEQIPDLILSDVMMPAMDGLELTRRIKTHVLTNHIPVVLLSARSEIEDRISGQQQGADAYLGKPFDEQELILTLQNLHILQRRWKERYASAPEQLISSGIETSLPHPTDVFMKSLYAQFERHFANDGYDLPQLCRDMEVSKSQLQRKLAALSDQSAMDLLRRYRLQKAQDILQTHPGLSIKEVGFRVGFKDPAHFTRMFTKVLGITPSEAKHKPPGN